MATVNELPRMARWLKTVLGADATLASLATGGIWDTEIPAGRPYPVVVFEFTAALDDTPGNGGERVWSRARFQVKAICEGNSVTPAQTIADRIDAVLEAVTGGVADVIIDSCRRVRPLVYREHPVDQNRGYCHVGGEYQIAAHYAG